MFNTIYIEIYKVFHKKNIYVFMGIILAFSLLLTKAMQLDPSVNSSTFPIALLKAMFMLIIPIFASILLGEVFSSEFRSGTLKILLTRPITRIQLLISKMIAIFLLISFLYTITLIFGVTLGAIFIKGPKTVTFLSTIQTYFLSIFPMFAFACLIAIFALLTKKDGSLVGISLSFLFASVIVGLAFRKINPYLITSYFNVTDLLVKNAGLTVKTVLIGWGVVFAYIVIPTLLCIWIFNKKDMA